MHIVRSNGRCFIIVLILVICYGIEAKRYSDFFLNSVFERSVDCEMCLLQYNENANLKHSNIACLCTLWTIVLIVLIVLLHN